MRSHRLVCWMKVFLNFGAKLSIVEHHSDNRRCKCPMIVLVDW